MELDELKYEAVYNTATEKLIASEFRRTLGSCYLDHAGATLYSERQMQCIQEELLTNVYSNPHSHSTSSQFTEAAVDQIRYEILSHFETTSSEYTVIFTSGATAALQLVAECFSYNGGLFSYLQDNHTSVLGMRHYAKQVKSFCHEEIIELMNKNPVTTEKGSHNSLFVYPAQCNFSGFKYPLGWIPKVQNGVLDNNDSWFCMIDAATFASTNKLDLSKYKPDFVCVSFYKMFGYPTGLGALLVKNTSGWVLEKKYYGGGTVYMALSDENTVVRRKKLNERFEDGTLPFLSILALKHGYSTFKRLNITMEIVSKHIFSLAKYVYKNLLSLHHANGAKACILYHDSTFHSSLSQGGIINFNLLRCDGSHIGYSEVQHVANLYRIDLRTGCCCNPGACQRLLNLSTSDIKYNFEKGHVCGDNNDLIDNKPTGSVRISFGYMSTKQNADEFLNMIIGGFIIHPIKRKLPQQISHKKTKFEMNFTYDNVVNQEGTISKSDNVSNLNLNASNVLNMEGVLSRIFLYPVKSCGAFSPKVNWKLISTGLQYDREWMIVNSNGVCLTQKNVPKMCLIKPRIDIEKDILILTCEGFQDINVSLTEKNTSIYATPCHSKVCGDQIQGWDCGNDVAKWLDDALNANGLRLLRQSVIRSVKQLSLVNKAQYLMLNKASVQWLLNCALKMNFHEDIDGMISRFRPNFVVDFDVPFIENDCKQFNFGVNKFINDGQCTRCQMICIDQSTGEKSVEPLKTLAKEFNGKISFGVYLKDVTTNDVASRFVNIGDNVII